MITYQQMESACDHATAWKCQLAIYAGAPEGNIRERIVSIPAQRAVPVGGGWVSVGHVVDTERSAWLGVWLHAASGRVGVERDPDDAPREVVESVPPISYHNYGPREYRADPRYRYFFDGAEYPPEEAEQLVAAHDSTAGWTWERIAE